MTDPGILRADGGAVSTLYGRTPTYHEAKLLAAVGRLGPQAGIRRLAREAGLDEPEANMLRHRLRSMGAWPGPPPRETAQARRDRLVRAWHADNPELGGEERAARQRELWAALAAVGGEHATGELLALCDDVEPFVAVFSARARPTQTDHPRHSGNARRVAALRALNARRFPRRVGKAVGP